MMGIEHFLMFWLVISGVSVNTSIIHTKWWKYDKQYNNQNQNAAIKEILFFENNFRASEYIDTNPNFESISSQNE